MEQMRQEKKKQKQIDKQNKQSNPNIPEFGESMTRLQKKIDDLTSHRRQMDEVEEEEDIINEKNIEKMRELTNPSSHKDNNN